MTNCTTRNKLKTIGNVNIIIVGGKVVIEYKDLVPLPAKIVLDDSEFTLRGFDLAAQVWAYNEFATPENKDGVENLSNRINDIKDTECILKCTWHLMNRKSHFGTYEKFVSCIDSTENKWNKIMELYQAFVKTLGVSQPKLEELAEELQIKKHSAAGN